MKSFFKFASLTFAIGILLAACSAEEPTVKPDPTPAQEKPNPYRKDLGDALKSADKMMASWSSASGFDGNPHHYDEDDPGINLGYHNGLTYDFKYLYLK